MSALVSRCGSEHNENVRTRARRVLGCLALLVATAVATGAFAELRASATAMACCRKTNYRCAGLSPPDDCCQQMGHVARTPGAATVASAPLLCALPLAAPAFSAEPTSAFPALRIGFAFKRPHDPPHLHTYSLLI